MCSDAFGSWVEGEGEWAIFYEMGGDVGVFLISGKSLVLLDGDVSSFLGDGLINR